MSLLMLASFIACNAGDPDKAPTDTGTPPSANTDDSGTTDDSGAPGTTDDSGTTALSMFTAVVEGIVGVVDAAPNADASMMYYGTSGAQTGLWRKPLLTGSAGPVAPPDTTTESELLAELDGLSSLAVAGDNVYVATGDAEIIEVNPLVVPATVTTVSGFGSGIGMSIIGNVRVGVDDAVVLHVGGLDADGAANVRRYEAGVVETLATWAGPAPSGLAITSDGTIYAAGGGEVREIVDGVVSVIASGVSLGAPAGIALTPDERTLLVSSLSDDGHSQVLLIDLATYAQSTVSDGISENVGSGGLHQAAGATNVYGWCGISSGGTGTVYRVEL